MIGTLVIAEDEKLIRQGISAMIRRSGVPVGMIIECPNGEKALEVIRREKTDVLFTDIRMPKMTGIELVQAISDMEEKPLIVAISGFDDFSYAVQMMQYGACDYLLKPIEREKLKNLLVKLDAEVGERAAHTKADETLCLTQLKEFLADGTLPEEVRPYLAKHLHADVTAGLRILVTQHKKGKAAGSAAGEAGILLSDMDGEDVWILPAGADLASYVGEGRQAGASAPFAEEAAAPSAYREARAARKEAFLREQMICLADEPFAQAAEPLVRAAEALCEEQEVSRRLQLIGTERRDEMRKGYEKFFKETALGRIRPELFTKTMEATVGGIRRKYGRYLPEAMRTELEGFADPFRFGSFAAFRDAFLDFLARSSAVICGHTAETKSERRMREAVEYVRAHYAEDLNMAVVSNYVSMNYSLFSGSFKEYTGMNFVSFLRDIRIREARRLLTETEQTVAAIGAAVGYQDDKHFLKTFKSVTGVTPNEYRRSAAGR